MKKTRLDIRVAAEKKATWVNAAKKQEISLTKFIQVSCDAAVKNGSLEKRVAKLEGKK